MSDGTKIEWTDATWNPTTGCTKISPGCKHCYAERDWARLSANPGTRYYGRKFTDVKCHTDVLDLPLRWTKPRRIFVNSMSDLFHDDVPDHFIDQVFTIMRSAPQHTFQILTKRPDRMRVYLSQFVQQCRYVVSTTRPQVWGDQRDGNRLLLLDEGQNWPLRHVWLGVSVENQHAADARIVELLKTPAAVRWISAEPLLGPVDVCKYLPNSYECALSCGARLDFPMNIRCLKCGREAADNYDQWGSGDTEECPNCGPTETEAVCPSCGEHMVLDHPDTPHVDWVVAGGESGPKARPSHPNWFRSLRKQCKTARVPFLFKQWGEWAPRSACYHTFEDGKSLSDYDPGAKKWPCIRLTECGNDGSELNHSGEGDDAYMQMVGKKFAGRLLDDVQHDGYPEQRQ